MTDEEAKGWLDNLPRDRQLEILKEYHALKEGLCARILGVATGSEWWVQASIERATQLRKFEALFRKLTHAISEGLEDAVWSVRQSKCWNCLGRKEINGHSCVICKGTGLTYL